jgi:hypothetical protein
MQSWIKGFKQVVLGIGSPSFCRPIIFPCTTFCWFCVYCYIWGVPDSNLGPETGCLVVFYFPLSPKANAELVKFVVTSSIHVTSSIVQSYPTAQCDLCNRKFVEVYLHSSNIIDEGGGGGGGGGDRVRDRDHHEVTVSDDSPPPNSTCTS